MLYTPHIWNVLNSYYKADWRHKYTDISYQSSICMCIGAENGRFPALFGLLITINYVFRLKE